MTDKDGKIRLPELAIFRRYSLALRQEFSQPADILAALRDTYAQLEELAGPLAKQLEAREKAPVKPEPQVASPKRVRATTRQPPPLEQGGFSEPQEEVVASPSHGSASLLDGGADENDPKSYLKRLAARPPSEDFLDDLVGHKAVPPPAPREAVPRDPALWEPTPAPAKANFEAWEGAPEAGKPTSEEDEERFWNRAKRRPRPKRQKGKTAGTSPLEDE